MVIYTRAGDDGLTYVPSFKRKVSKDHIVLEVLGTLDELNSMIGLIRSFSHGIEKLKELNSVLRNIQVKLFYVGFSIARTKRGLITDSDVEVLEKLIDKYSLSINTNVFVLPSGHRVAALLHVARAVCRRFERRLVELRRLHPDMVEDVLLRYVNRLSDFLYVVALYVNKVTGISEERVKV